jgi:hypothetical protein
MLRVEPEVVSTESLGRQLGVIARQQPTFPTILFDWN